MPAGMHAAGHVRGVGFARSLRDGQGIHVGAQANHAAGTAIAPLDDPDNARAADARSDFVDTEGAQQVGDAARRALHVIKQLGVAVEIVPPLGDLALKLGDAIDDGHGALGW